MYYTMGKRKLVRHELPISKILYISSSWERELKRSSCTLRARITRSRMEAENSPYFKVFERKGRYLTLDV